MDGVTAAPSIVEFLNARYAEQEQPLREVVRQLDAHEASDDDEGIDGGWNLWGSFGLAVAAAFKPRQALRDVEAKRRIIELHSGGHECSGYDHNGDIDHYRYYHEFETCSTVLLLALHYADHKDYQKEWSV